MMEKLKVNRYPGDVKGIVQKINEIIDHIPQEKEEMSLCEGCTYSCKQVGIVIKCKLYEPTKEVQKKEPLYHCKDCGKLRTKAEGGTTFTVCDECWDKHYKPNEKEYNVCQYLGCKISTNGNKFCSLHSIDKKEECKCEDKNTNYHLTICCKQPTKEVPDIPSVEEIANVIRKHEAYSTILKETLIRATPKELAQEISALYRKEKV